MIISTANKTVTMRADYASNLLAHSLSCNYNMKNIAAQNVPHVV